MGTAVAVVFLKASPCWKPYPSPIVKQVGTLCVLQPYYVRGSLCHTYTLHRYHMEELADEERNHCNHHGDGGGICCCCHCARHPNTPFTAVAGKCSEVFSASAGVASASGVQENGGGGGRGGGIRVALPCAQTLFLSPPPPAKHAKQQLTNIKKTAVPTHHCTAAVSHTNPIYYIMCVHTFTSTCLLLLLLRWFECLAIGL